MKKQLEYKLKEFADIRKFAETTQRKELIDQQVRVYLGRRCKNVSDWIEGYATYKEMYVTRK